MEQSSTAGQRREPWNKGKLVGQKSPLRLKDAADRQAYSRSCSVRFGHRQQVEGM